MNKNNLKYLFFYLFLIVSVDCFAQLTIFERNTSHSFEFLSSNSYCSQTPTIISEIAKANQKGLTATSYQIDFTLSESVKRIDESHYVLFAEIKEINLHGDVLYRHMNIEHLLMPQMISFDFTLYRNDVSFERVLLEENVKNNRLLESLGYYTILDKTFQDSLSNKNYSISLRNISFSYDSDGYELLMQTVKLIEAYYLADVNLENISAKLAVIDFNDLQRVAFNYVVIQEVDKEIQSLQQKNFQQKLQLWKADPIGFSERIEKLEKQSLWLKTQIHEKHTHLDKLYFEEGKRQMSMGHLDSAMFYYEKTIEFNRTYTPALIEKSFVEYNKDLFDTAVETLIYLYENAIVQADERQRLIEVSKMIISAAANSIVKEIDNQNYTTAIEKIEYLEKLCNTSTDLHCLSEIQAIKAKSIHGMYRSYLTVVEKAIENKKFEIATVYIEAAKDYQKENSLYIINSLEAEHYYQKIVHQASMEIERLIKINQTQKSIELAFWLEDFCNSTINVDCQGVQAIKEYSLREYYNSCIRLIKAEIDKKKQNSAENLLSELENFIAQHKEISFDEQYKHVQKALATLQYQNAINSGLKHKESKNTASAYADFVTACRLQQKFDLVPNANFQKQSASVIREYLPIKMSADLNNFNLYTYSEFVGKLAYYDTIINCFQLAQVETVSQLYNNLLNYEKQFLCDSISKQCMLGLVKTRNNIENQKFASAKAILDSVQAIKLQNYLCDILNFDEYVNISALNHAVEWEKKMENISILYQLGEYEKVLVEYDELLQYIKPYSIDEIYVLTIPIETFIWNFKNPELLKVAFDYFYQNKNYDLAFMVLDYLRQIEVPATSLKTQQKNIGEKLAVRDKINNYDANYKVNILKYSEGDSFYLYFSKSYKKTWKKH